MTHVRLLGVMDVEQAVDLVYEAHHSALMSRGLALNSGIMARTMAQSISTPERCPCFVHEDGLKLTGMLFGMVYDTWFVDHKWFEERVFYIRPEYRTYALAKAYIKALEEWCKEQSIKQIELNNASTRDPRMNLFYRRLGYSHVNTTHAKRL